MFYFLTFTIDWKGFMLEFACEESSLSPSMRLTFPESLNNSQVIQMQ